MPNSQYEEFLTLDRPLSAEAIAIARALSRRVQPTPTQAIFTYSYGDFPASRRPAHEALRYHALPGELGLKAAGVPLPERRDR